MNTELATQQSMAMSSHGVQIRTIDDALRLSEAIASSSLAPKGYGGKPNDIFVAIQMGAEVGLSPMQSLQNIAVINGRPSMWGDAGMALLLSSGVVEDFHESLEKVNGSLTATTTIYRHGIETPFVGRFSWEDAKRASLAGKSIYQSYPKRMLQMRARWFAMRDGFADVLKGIAGREELADKLPDTPHEAEVAEPADIVDAQPEDTSDSRADALLAQIEQEPPEAQPEEPASEQDESEAQDEAKYSQVKAHVLAASAKALRLDMRKKTDRAELKRIMEDAAPKLGADLKTIDGLDKVGEHLTETIPKMKKDLLEAVKDSLQTDKDGAKAAIKSCAAKNALDLNDTHGLLTVQQMLCGDDSEGDTDETD